MNDKPGVLANRDLPAAGVIGLAASARHVPRALPPPPGSRLVVRPGCHITASVQCGQKIPCRLWPTLGLLFEAGENQSRERFRNRLAEELWNGLRTQQSVTAAEPREC